MDQEVGGFAGADDPLDRGFAGLAGGKDPLDRDLVVEEEGDLCSLWPFICLRSSSCSYSIL